MSKPYLQVLYFCFILVGCQKTFVLSDAPLSTNNAIIQNKDSLLAANDTVSYTSSVFINGENGYKVYRIPAIIKASDSILIAFCEARKNGFDDFGDIDIVSKTSIDFGKTWSNFNIIANNGILLTSNPVPIYDILDPAYPKGKVHLFYRTGNESEWDIKLGKGIYEIWHIVSIDNGKTWSKPRNITLDVHKPNQPTFNTIYNNPAKWTYFAPGPCHGIQTTIGPAKGRIIVPVNFSIFNKGNFGFCFYSDDFGKTFKCTGMTDLEVSEVTVAECSNGDILMNSRNFYIPNIRKRIRTVVLFSQFQNPNLIYKSSFDNNLDDPNCQGSMLNFTTLTNRGVILFSNPESIVDRINIRVKQSYTDGNSWTNGYLVSTTGGYTDLVAVHKNRVGIFYENKKYPDTLKFHSFPYSKIPK